MTIEKIADGLKSVKLKSGIFPLQLELCLYIADGVLIDAGSGNTLKQIKKLLDTESISCAAITHVHEDHTGAAAWIKKNLKVPVYLHRDSIAEAAEKSHVPLYRRLVWGNREGFRADPMPPFIESDRYRFDVIHAPGHHKDHVVFHEKRMGWLFTGDLYVSRKQLVAFKDENISDAIISITEILELDFDTVFCGHSGIHQNGKTKLREKLDNFLHFRDEVNTLKSSGLTIDEINRKLFPEKNLWETVSRGEWSSMNLVRTV